MKKILFVNNETKILEGLPEVLRSMQHEWEVAFANQAQVALERLNSQPFDILVTEMYAPGINGAQLLEMVREFHPQVVRIALSVHSDQESILRSLGLAHQYLSKPCNVEVLKQTLQRVCTLRDLLTNEKLKGLVSQLDSLPSTPQLYLELTRELQSLDASQARIDEIVSQDVAMTAKLLQIVNSAFFGLRRHIANPGEAVTFLGFETLRALALSLQVFAALPVNPNTPYSPASLWPHSLQVGQLAKTIAKAEKQRTQVVDEAFTAGLLHEIGSLILASKLPQQYAEAVALSQNASHTLVEAEREVFGVGHPEVGAYLLGLWGLPDTIVEAVAFHHEPSRYPTLGFTSLTAVHLADHLVSAATEGEPPCLENAPLDENYLATFSLNSSVEQWQEYCKHALQASPN